MFAKSLSHRVELACIALAVAIGGLLPQFTPHAARAQAGDSPAGNEELQDRVNSLYLQLELSFRGQAAEFRHRQDTLRAAIAAWSDSAQSETDYEIMRAWLEQATRAALPGKRTAMPAPPQFPAAEVAQPQPQPAAKLREAAEPAPTEPTNRVLLDRPEPEPEPEPGPELAADINPAVQTAVVEPPAATAGVQPSAPAQSAPAQSIGVKAPPTPTRPLTPLVAKQETDSDLGDPFVDDPLPTPTANLSAPRVAAVEAHDTPPPAVFQPQGRFDSTVRVDVAQVSAMARGYSQALNFVEAQLLASDSPSAGSLIEAVSELESLATQRDVLRLYLTAVGDDEREQIGRMRSAGRVIAIVEQQLAQLREQLADERSAVAANERQLLNGVEQRLATIASQSID